MLEQANRANACSSDTTVRLIYSDDAEVNNLAHAYQLLGAAAETLAALPREPMAASELERVDSLIFVSRSLVAASVVKLEDRAPMPAAPATSSDFAALLSDYHQVDKKLEAAIADYEELFKRTVLPDAVVRTGRRRVACPVTGGISWARWEFTTRAQIEQHFARFPAWMHPQGSAGIASERDTLLAELDDLKKVQLEAERNCGLLAANDVVRAAEKQAVSLFAELTSYRPATAIEVSAKAEFFLDFMQGAELEADEMATILRSFLGQSSHTSPTS